MTVRIKPQITLTANGVTTLTFYQNETEYRLDWSSQGATSCIASGSWSGVKTLSGNEKFTISPFMRPNEIVHTLTCTASNGLSSSATVTIYPNGGCTGISCSSYNEPREGKAVLAKSATTTPYSSVGVIIQRTTYRLAGQTIAVQVAGDPDGNNGLYYLHSDHLGSASSMSDTAGERVGEITRYTPFGETRTSHGNEAVTDMGFTGHKHNDSIGLIYMNARFYVPSIGRFASADSIVPNLADPQTYNRYSYVINNPLKYIDPTGHILILPTKYVRGRSGHLKYDSLGGEYLSGRFEYDFDVYHPLTNHSVMDTARQVGEENREFAKDALVSLAFLLPVIGDTADVYDIGRAVVNGRIDEAILLGILTAAPGSASRLLDKGKDWLRAGGLTDELADDVLRIADDALGAVCSFSGDTLVMTEDGLVPISEIQPDDKVLAYDEVTGEMGYYPVTQVWVHDDPILIRLVIDGEVIWTTPEHPFYLGNGQWVSAGDLQDGDLIRNANWQLGKVQDVTTIYQTRPMYNLSVDTAHTYFVGQQQWLVHNSRKCKIINSNMTHASERAMERAGFTNMFDASEALRDFGKNLEDNGIPVNAIIDPAHADRIIVPGFGDGGAVVYQVTKNGKLRLKTVLEWREP